MRLGLATLLDTQLQSLGNYNAIAAPSTYLNRLLRRRNLEPPRRRQKSLLLFENAPEPE